MRRIDLIIGAFVSTAVHVALFCAGSFSTPAVAMFDSGESCLTVRLMPSFESRPSVAQRKSQPRSERQETIPEPPKRQPVKHETQLVRFAKPEIIPEEELALKVREASPEEETEEPPDLTPVVKDALVRVEDVEPERPRGSAQPDERNRHEATESSVNSPASKRVDADMLEKGAVVPPSLTGLEKPEYPASCRRAGHEGVAIFEVTVLPDGSCGEIVLLQSAGCPKLDEAAERALRRAKFIPAKRFGIPVRSKKKIAFRFELKSP